jgi:hypothetical protein
MFVKNQRSESWTLRNMDEFLYLFPTFIFRFVRKFGKRDLSLELLNTCDFGNISTAQVALLSVYGGA